MKRSLYALLVFCTLLSSTAHAASDLQWTFTSVTTSAWRITAISSSTPSTLPATLVFTGAVPSNSPTINLIVGKRYQITNSVTGNHYVEILAMGATATNDIVLLSEFNGGTLAGNSGINFTNDGNGHIEFTMTSTLATAMVQSGHTPGYRCEVHPTMMRGSFTLFGTGTTIANPIPAALPLGDKTIALAPLVSGLVAPLGVSQSDDESDNRLFIHDQVGKIWIYRDNGLLSTPYLDVSSRLVTLTTGYDERGLLGIAFHPNFAANHKIYTFTSEPVGPPADFTVPHSSAFNCQTVIAEWQVDGANPDRIDPATRRELLRIDKPQSNHNGGGLHFGPDGMLYISTGDGGNSNDVGDGHAVPFGNGQDLTNALGKILRIDVDTTNSANRHYGIPADNPTLGSVHEIWAYGFRNPFSFSFDKADGTLYVGDVGQNDVEEVDRVTKGGNFGWHFREGRFNFNPANGTVVTSPPLPIPPGTTLIDPIAQYDHDEGQAIIGGCVYRGTKNFNLLGHYVTGDLGGPFARLFYIDDSANLVEFNLAPGSSLSGRFLKAISQDRAGELYLCTGASTGLTGTTGRVQKIVSTISSVPPAAWNYRAPR